MNTADRWWPSTRHWLARLSQAKSTIAHDSPMTPTRLLDAARTKKNHLERLGVAVGPVVRPE